MSKIDPARVLIGRVVANSYRLLSHIGHGGMGDVFVARHVPLGHTVAIKVLSPEALCPTNVARFMREARAMMDLHSEHVASVLDVGFMDEGLPYIVMEHLRGRDFAYLVGDHARFTVDEAVTSIVQVASALGEAHALGIVHRDLKPSNLFLTQRPDGRWFVKVLDFGISKIREEQDDQGITASGDVFGTPAYMSPEQVRCSKHVDARADIWSLGLILAECLSGQPVFQGSTQLGILAGAAQVTAPDLHLRGLGVPRGLEKVIRRCLERNPANRYQSVEDLVRALQPFAARRPVFSTGKIGRVAEVKGEDHDAPTLVEQRRDEPSGVKRKYGIAMPALALLLVGLGMIGLLVRMARTDAASAHVSTTAHHRLGGRGAAKYALALEPRGLAHAENHLVSPLESDETAEAAGKKVRPAD